MKHLYSYFRQLCKEGKANIVVPVLQMIKSTCVTFWLSHQS